MACKENELKLRLRLHETESVYNRYEIGTDKPCVYTRPVRSALDLLSYSVPNQVVPGHGNPQESRQCSAVIYSNTVALNTKLFTRYGRKHPSKKINTKELPEKLYRCFQGP